MPLNWKPYDITWNEKAFERPHDKTNKMAYAPSEDTDQPGHLPSLIKVLAVCMKKAWVLSYPLSAQRRLWSDWADAQADLSLRRAHSHFVGFVMRRLIWLAYLRHSMRKSTVGGLWPENGKPIWFWNKYATIASMPTWTYSWFFYSWRINFVIKMKIWCLWNMYLLVRFIQN